LLAELLVNATKGHTVYSRALRPIFYNALWFRPLAMYFTAIGSGLPIFCGCKFSAWRMEMCWRKRTRAESKAYSHRKCMHV
jgi:hypothetical protein